MKREDVAGEPLPLTAAAVGVSERQLSPLEELAATDYRRQAAELARQQLRERNRPVPANDP